MLYIALIAFVPAAEPAPAVKPVGMVLEVEGQATLTRGDRPARPLRDMDLLVPGDRLEAGDGPVELVLLADGHAERLAPGKSVTVQAKGCTPADAVTRQAARLAGGNLEALREMARSAHAGIGTLRGTEDERASAIRPLRGSAVLSGRPTLSWPTARGAGAYTVRLFVGRGADRQLLWKAAVDEPRLSYPGRQAALRPGRTYYWDVLRTQAGTPRVVAQGRFSVLTIEEAADLEKLKPLTESKSPSDWLLAAAAYEAANVFDAALPLYEKLAEKRSRQAGYQRALANYYRRSDQEEKARLAAKRAAELESNKE